MWSNVGALAAAFDVAKFSAANMSDAWLYACKSNWNSSDRSAAFALRLASRAWENCGVAADNACPVISKAPPKPPWKDLPDNKFAPNVNRAGLAAWNLLNSCVGGLILCNIFCCCSKSWLSLLSSVSKPEVIPVPLESTGVLPNSGRSVIAISYLSMLQGHLLL